MPEENLEIKNNNNRTSKGRKGGSRRSKQGYIMTYSRLQKEKTFDSSAFSSERTSVFFIYGRVSQVCPHGRKHRHVTSIQLCRGLCLPKRLTDTPLPDVNGVGVPFAIGCDVVERGQKGLGVVAVQVAAKGRGVADAVVPADGDGGASQWHTGVAVGVKRLGHATNLQ